MTTLILNNLRKSYTQGETSIDVLKGINLRLEEGESVSIVGPSGGGKSTLLSILSGIDKSNEGQLLIQDTDISQLSDHEMTLFRGKNFGIIFQQFHLISHLTALENVMLPLEILQSEKGISISSVEIKEKAIALLGEVGLSQRLTHYPSQLSGGEAQRVAIARALISNPKILLADEPSGNLDVKTGEHVMSLLFELVKKYKSTLLLVTHSPELAKQCERSFALEGGKLIELKNV